jgi:hypothetical protein
MLGMATLARTDGNQAVGVSFTDTHLVVSLRDGRSISTPVEWYPRLRDASSDQRLNWRIIGTGVGVHWPDVDEDLSVEGMLAGRGAPGWRTMREG